MKLLRRLIASLGTLCVIIAVVCIMIIGWIVGFPITVKQNDKKVGTIRWFKYTKELQ